MALHLQDGGLDGRRLADLAEDVARFETQERRFRAGFDKLLDQQTAQTGGYIPPALEMMRAAEGALA